jgi:acyl CoA:acetate/3-ketoacid CoA transferase
MMGFAPIVSPHLKEMDSALFAPDGPCGLAAGFARP